MQAIRILIIEDDPGSRNALSAILEDEGYEVRAAATGEAGVRCAKTFRPDFAIIDVHLPDANGIELIRELHGVEPNCACLIASGSATMNTHEGRPRIADFSEEARQAGAIEYLGKPINLDRLLDTLGDSLRDDLC